jgi:hypothetical protein
VTIARPSLAADERSGQDPGASGIRHEEGRDSDRTGGVVARRRRESGSFLIIASGAFSRRRRDRDPD